MGQTTGDSVSASRSSAEIARTLADNAARRRAVIVAGHTGQTDTAEAGLHDEDPAVRASALIALQRLGQLRRDSLISAIADADERVRRTAAQVTATWTDPRTDGADGSSGDASAEIDLTGLLADPVAEVVEVAAWACGERAPDPDESPGRSGGQAVDGRVVDELIALATSHDDALVREAAVASLGAIGDRRGLPAILQATTDKATVRRRAVIALAPFEGDEVDAALDHALADRDWQVRQAAEDLRS